MSGWIKFEKDLLTDPRVLRVAKSLSNRFSLSETTSSSEVFECGNDHALPAVTLVCGALARLWVLADTHIGSDNVLPLGCDELNEILGIPDFCESLPEDWLVVIDDSHVQLPEFHEHNGTEAKKKAVTQKRVSRWRNKQNDKPLPRRNGRALPDQDQDQDHKEGADAPPQPIAFNPQTVTGLNVDAWGKWLDHRKAIKKPIRPHSMQDAAEELAKLGDRQLDEVKRAIAGGWQGIHPEKNAAAAKPAAQRTGAFPR